MNKMTISDNIGQGRDINEILSIFHSTTAVKRKIALGQEITEYVEDVFGTGR